MSKTALLNPDEDNNQIRLDQLDKAKIDLLKKTICKDATDNELELFIHACNRTRLDPFMKQIYAIKRGGQMTIQTGIDGLRLIAERTGNYAPGREPTFSFNDKNELISATGYVKKRLSDGSWHEVGATAFFEEFNAGQNLWKKMPRLMLAKCAESLALRKAFPADMSGVYTSEEMEQADQELPEASSLLSPDECDQMEAAITAIPGLRDRILKAYGKNSFEEIEARHSDIIWKGIRNEHKKAKPAEVQEIPL